MTEVTENSEVTQTETPQTETQPAKTRKPRIRKAEANKFRDWLANNSQYNDRPIKEIQDVYKKMFDVDLTASFIRDVKKKAKPETELVVPPIE